MRKIIEIWVVAVSMVLMTTLSLLPHHHHGCSEGICLMPIQCEQHASDDQHNNCAPEEDHHHHDDDEHCSLRVIDMSTAKSSELINPGSQPILLFLCQTELVCLFQLQQVGIVEIDESEDLPLQLKHPILGLRAPPMA